MQDRGQRADAARAPVDRRDPRRVHGRPAAGGRARAHGRDGVQDGVASLPSGARAPRRRRAAARRSLPGAVRGHLARLSRLVPARRRRRAAVVRRLPLRAGDAHARARPDLRAAGAARRRRRPRRADALALRPAAARDRLLAGRAHAPRAAARPQLRLRPQAARGRDRAHRVHRPPRARDERLPVGAARRRQRRRARDVARVRRPPRDRSRLRDAADRPLPARAVRDHARGRRRARPAAGAGRRTTSRSSTARATR